MAKHRTFKPEFKARVVLQILTGAKTAAQICREHQLSEQLLTSWKKQLLAHAGLVFAQERESTTEQTRLAELEQMVGRLTMELEAAKKSLAALEPSLQQKREVIEMLKSDYPTSLLCDLLAAPRSSFYYQPTAG